MDARDPVRPLLKVRQVREFTDAPVEAAALDAIADAGQPQSRSLATAAAAIAIAMPQVEGAGIVNAFDEGRAAERMLVAASLLDLGAAIAWVRADVRPIVSELLGVPDGRFVRTILAVGHPTEEAARPKSDRGSGAASPQ